MRRKVLSETGSKNQQVNSTLAVSFPFIKYVLLFIIKFRFLMEFS